MTKLEQRRKQYDIPDVPYLPVGKTILIYRLPNETVTAGGIHIPQTAEEPKPQGVLLAAGLAALDVMNDALVEIGDIVWFAKYAGWEKSVKSDPGNKDKDIIQMKIEDLLGSEDALGRLGKGKVRLAFDEEEGEHYYEEVA